MTDEARKLRNEYCKKWQREHPENVKRNAARYWEKKARQMAAQTSDQAGNQQDEG